MRVKNYSPAGHLIIRARKAAGMTQRQLSTATGLAPSRISEYENGSRDPTVNTLLKLLAATGHTVTLADMADSNFPNPYVNNVRLLDLLDLVDALPPSRPRRGAA